MSSSTSKYLLAASIALAQMSSESLGAEGNGGKAGAFLRLGAGARAMAMGNAYTGLADDASAVYWNPAGLGHVQQSQLLGMYSALSLERQHSFLALAYPIGDRLAFGVGWLHFGVGKIDGRDAGGNPTSKFDDSENAFMFSAAWRKGFIAIGATGKYLRHTLADFSASGFSFDAGLRFRMHEFFTIGLVAQDLAGKLTWDTSSDAEDKLPIVWRTGVALHPPNFPLIITGELADIEGETFFRVGGEYRLLNALRLRAGYNDDGLTAGAAVVIKASALDVQLDYAFGNEVLEEGSVHRVGMLLGF